MNWFRAFAAVCVCVCVCVQVEKLARKDRCLVCCGHSVAYLLEMCWVWD